MTVFGGIVYASGIKQQARYARGSMFDVMGSNDVVLRSRANRPKTKLDIMRGDHRNFEPTIRGAGVIESAIWNQRCWPDAFVRLRSGMAAA